MPACLDNHSEEGKLPRKQAKCEGQAHTNIFQFIHKWVQIMSNNWRVMSFRDKLKTRFLPICQNQIQGLSRATQYKRNPDSMLQWKTIRTVVSTFITVSMCHLLLGACLQMQTHTHTHNTACKLRLYFSEIKLSCRDQRPPSKTKIRS